MEVQELKELPEMKIDFARMAACAKALYLWNISREIPDAPIVKRPRPIYTEIHRPPQSKNVYLYDKTRIRRHAYCVIATRQEFDIVYETVKDDNGFPRLVERGGSITVIMARNMLRNSLITLTKLSKKALAGASKNG
ncbi:MAG: hypothetical protein LBN96_04625 [Desulfovibrio sp.]|jgi:hypothetical protein|nr:hypothetical protein [Desulfovibrio sp.]